MILTRKKDRKYIKNLSSSSPYPSRIVSEGDAADDGNKIRQKILYILFLTPGDNSS